MWMNLDPSEREFLELKAPLVLFILDRRLAKAGGSTGLSRIIFKVCLMAKVGDLPNGAIDTQVFIRQCEKHGHIKLESFYTQWIEGAGCPKFRVTQKFNKKKLTVEMLITQYQAENTKDRDLESSTFMRDVKEEQNEVWAGSIQPAFTGPMTIRIHEADGTPYEHIIDISQAKQTVDIPYITKYKRLKRSRRQKERTTATNNVEFEGGGGDEPLINCLGDVLDTAEEEAAWRLATWSKDDEDKMSGESYEWIRMDADFEWICKMTVQMPAYMFVSQLRQDRDVVAQFESLQFMAAVQSHPLVSTELVKTLVDERYFHGVRTAAAEILAKNAKYEHDWIGQFHLEKTFQTFFCYDDSPMTRSNDFSNRTSYKIQCAIIQAIAKIRDASGKSPLSVRTFLFEKLKFNDNSNNEFSDCHYLATLMKALAEALAVRPPPRTITFDDFDHDDGGDDDHFHNSCLEEIDRYRRMDEWIPSYHNVLSTTALDCKKILSKAGSIKHEPADYLQYTADGTSPYLRLSAFSNLMTLGAFKTDAILRWFLFVLSTDPSPYIRNNLLEIFNRTLGSIAIGEHLAPVQATQPDAAGGLTIEQESSTEARQLDLARKKTILGALNALKDELSSNEVLKTELWNAITSPTLSLHRMGDLLEICDLLYTPETKLIVALKYPRYWKCTKVGKGKLLFKHSDRIRTKQIAKPQRPIPTVSPAAPPPTQPAIKRENSSGG
ncbi:transcription initiation factor TFIID subunit 2, partial [Lecanoromycetidae sp. Uapishka_2]